MTSVFDRCQQFENSTLLSIYIIGMAASLSTCCTFVATFTCIIARETRDKNLCVGAWALLSHIIGSIILNISGLVLSSYPNPNGIVDVFFTISLLMGIMAAIMRYTSEIKGKPRLLINRIAKGLAIVFLIFIAVLNLTQSFVPLMDVSGIASSIMIVIPIYHIVLALVYASSRFKAAPPSSYSQTYLKDRIFRDFISLLIAAIWISFLIFWIIADLLIYRVQILMVCQALALICEVSITSASLKNETDQLMDNEIPKDNFFATTVLREEVPHSIHRRVDSVNMDNNE